jgi:hypothetical protein
LRARPLVRSVNRMGHILAPETSAELLGWSARRSGHLLPDGTPVTVYVQFTPEGAAVSDLGGTLPLLRLLPPLLRFAVRNTCRRNDVQIDRGSLVVHVPSGGDVGEAVDRLGRVCAQVSAAASEAADPGN